LEKQVELVFDESDDYTSTRDALAKERYERKRETQGEQMARSVASGDARMIGEIAPTCYGLFKDYRGRRR
jgi:hypothetical protein